MTTWTLNFIYFSPSILSSPVLRSLIWFLSYLIRVCTSVFSSWGIGNTLPESLNTCKLLSQEQINIISVGGRSLEWKLILLAFSQCYSLSSTLGLWIRISMPVWSFFIFVNYCSFCMEALNVFSLSLRFKNKIPCLTLAWCVLTSISLA